MGRRVLLLLGVGHEGGVEEDGKVRSGHLYWGKRLWKRRLK